MPVTIRRTLAASVLLVALMLLTYGAAAQQPSQTSQIAQGVPAIHAKPTDRLVVRNAMVIYGNAKPPYGPVDIVAEGDRKSTRLNSSHLGISYAVFCLKKKKKKNKQQQEQKQKTKRNKRRRSTTS